MTPSASTSNLTRFLIPFGLLLAFPPLQRPIRHVFSFLLDFLRDFHYFEVQSTTLAHNKHLQPHKSYYYTSALTISAALTIFLRLASVSGTPLVLSPQSGFTHSLSLSIFVSIIFIARVISSTDGILGE